MKKHISILLIIILLLPAAVTIVTYQYQKKKIKKQVKSSIIEGLPIQDLIAFEFTANQLKNLKWKHSKEFEYNGKMYDIVIKQEEENITKLWCWPDEEETQLNLALKNQVINLLAGQTQQSNQTQIFSNFIKSFFLNEFDFKVLPVFSWMNKPKSQYFFAIVSVFVFIEIPPPKRK